MFKREYQPSRAGKLSPPKNQSRKQLPIFDLSIADSTTGSDFNTTRKITRIKYDFSCDGWCSLCMDKGKNSLYCRSQVDFTSGPTVGLKSKRGEDISRTWVQEDDLGSGSHVDLGELRLRGRKLDKTRQRMKTRGHSKRMDILSGGDGDGLVPYGVIENNFIAKQCTNETAAKAHKASRVPWHRR